MRNKILYLTMMLFCVLLNAQTTEEPCPPGVVCGGVGGNGYGSQASPIDMYIYVLATAAILMIVYFAKKYKTQKI